ncbi:MAG: aldo/keto reductase, partial [Spirochaetaceae bacterium]|nr:aldo/keto reductase [Spirochaetaceae bacterium]
MQYRRLGSRVTEEISALGFGCMRFPTLGEASEIDRSQAGPMLKYAIDHGVNYVDTAWPYHGGESENLVGEVLAGGYRDKVLLATKMPMWDVNE